MQGKITRLFLVLIIFNCQSVFAQLQNSQWCFGSGAGLDFNSGSPVPFTSSISTTEGSSSIADQNGNLLFYTDGITVWNNNHTAMPNGTGLNGGQSSTQSALIVKQPLSNDLYYIFTTDEGQGPDGFCYSIVDMSLQGGVGDVTIKNVQLFTPSAEKVCGTFHSNGTDIWVVGHELGTDIFRSYLLTASGLNTTPVITASGLVHQNINGTEIGYMKISPDGQHLALAIRYQFTFQLFDFDNSSGVVSNPVTIPSTNGTIAYGVEFSPDNTRLYLTDTQLSQFDISIIDSSTINNSKVILGQQDWALQLGIDHKIYAANYTVSDLGVINDPNNAGLACNYAPNAISLTGQCQLGLPNLVWMIDLPPVAIFTAPHHVCPGTCTYFNNLSLRGTSFQWIFPGGSPGTSTDFEPANICYLTPGVYDVTLIAVNSVGSDTLTLTNYITVFPYSPSQSVLQNGDTLFSNTGFTAYQWFFDGDTIPGATNYFHVAWQSGNYSVVCLDNNGCSVEAVLLNVLASIQYTIDNQQPIVVYPNPVVDKFTIHNSQFTIEAASSISIYNMLGETVFSAVDCLPDGQAGLQSTIDCRLLPKGVYWLEIMNGSNTFRTKFIKQ